MLCSDGFVLFDEKIDSAAGIMACLTGEPLADDVHNVSKPELLRKAPQPAAHHDPKKFEAPGTIGMALLLLVTFVVYYFINWKYLASVWPLG